MKCLRPALDWNITGASAHVHIAFQPTQAEIGKRFAGAKKDGGSRRHPYPVDVLPGFFSCIRATRVIFLPATKCFQVRRVSTKFWPAALVQLSWLMEIIRQLKLTGVWRISDVPWISTDVGPVMV